MEAGVPSAKKARRLPEVLVPTVPSQSMVGLVKSTQQQQQLPMIQPFQFQPPPPQERKRSMLTPAPPQGAPIYHFYQHQIQQQQQQLHRIPSQNLQQPPVPRRIHKRIEEFHDDREPPSNPPWATAPAAMPLPVSLTMPLHALSPTSYAAAIASPPPPPNAGPVRRVGSKRAPAPATEDWRFANGGGMNFMAGPPPPPPPPPGARAPGGFLVSPASFAGPVSVSVAGGASQRMSSTPSPRLSPVTTTSTANPARAAAIEKRRSKLKQVSAAYHLELESQCQKLLLLQRECRDSDCTAAAAAARDVSGIAV
ncbi:formin-like protein 20 [Selaginella moellendorffii]|uniref:formin-like protein 20 n=1 Tax=Selaginella moellendorffii TaxID=88036 RepID=UPI000D1C4481|nr:formin-like protein 20 [Selaginella moellendorffii]|eukprot:XP_024528771.1 formin-like protein 20 [Selaginella moellendorffii]